MKQSPRAPSGFPRAAESGARLSPLPPERGRAPQPEPLMPFKPISAHMDALLRKVKP